MGRAFVAADRLFAAAFGILVTYVAAGLLSVEQFGLWVAFEAARVGVLTCFDRTVGQAFVFRTASDLRTSHSTAAAALALKLAVVAALAFAALAAGAFGPAFLDARWYAPALAFPAWVLLSMVHTTVQQGLQAKRAYGALAVTDAVAPLLFAAAVWLRSEVVATPAGLMWTAAACRALAGLCFAHELVVRERPQWSIAMDLVRFARAAFVNNLATYVSLRADGLLLALFATLAAAAQWGLVAPLLNAYMLLGEAASLELFPEVSAAAAAGNSDRVRHAVGQAARVWCGIAVVVSAIVVLVRPELWLPGDAGTMAGVARLFALTAIAGPILVLARIFAAVLNGYGVPVRNAHATLVGLTVKGTVGVALIYAFAATGAAMTLILTTSAILLVAGTAAAGCWREPRVLHAPRTA